MKNTHENILRLEITTEIWTPPHWIPTRFLWITLTFDNFSSILIFSDQFYVVFNRSCCKLGYCFKSWSDTLWKWAT